MAKISSPSRMKILRKIGVSLWPWRHMTFKQLEKLDKIVHSIAAKKFLTSYLIKEGVKEDVVNSKLNKSVDELYGKPYDEKKTSGCDKFINKLIPESKKEIEKLVRSGIY